MQPSQKNGKKSNINSTQEIFSESDSQLTADLTEVEPDLTSSPPETLTQVLTEDLTEDLTENLTPFAQVCQNIGISRETGYKRMELLKIKPWKNKGKSLLDTMQVNHMNGLQEYYKEQGKLDGYPVPERSGPWEEEAEHPSEEDNTTITVSQLEQDTSTSESEQDTSASESEQDTSTSESQQDTSAGKQRLATMGGRILATRGGRTPNTPEMEAINNLVRSAQNKAAGVLIAENFLANQYIQNPESLPDNLKEKIKESAQTAVIDPFAYANSLIDFARAGEAVG